jgi:hypothetical protein
MDPVVSPPVALKEPTSWSLPKTSRVRGFTCQVSGQVQSIEKGPQKVNSVQESATEDIRDAMSSKTSLGVLRVAKMGFGGAASRLIKPADYCPIHYPSLDSVRLPLHLSEPALGGIDT